MDEFGMGSSTSHSAYGPALNPWNSTTHSSPEDVLSPGGSSGGSAGVVASFLCHGAIGSDTGGSVRQPASFCGVVGFKPSYGSLSRHGLISYASSFDTPGVLARSVMDAALLFDAMYRGKDENDPTSVNLFPSTALSKSLFSPGAPLSSLLSPSSPPLSASSPALDILQSLSESQSELSSSSLHGVVVGVPSEYSLTELDPQIRAHWETSLRMLRDAGATIRPVSAPSLRMALPTYYLLACAEASSNLSRYDGIRYGYRSSPSLTSRRSGAGDPLESIAGDLHREMSRSRGEGFGPQVLRRILAGTFVLSESAHHDYFDRAVLARQRIVAELGGLLDLESPLTEGRVDCIVGPTSPILPFYQAEQPDFASMLLNDFMTVAANLTGAPAIR
jgi:aspartyl-tRNA(Asn)/glutamyl-tRNA(Gln) amidotransferase subunit A